MKSRAQLIRALNFELESGTSGMRVVGLAADTLEFSNVRTYL